ncbi:MAG: L-threonylcarbamoyladenylate synthase [Saprospiraceae bacterium]
MELIKLHPVNPEKRLLKKIVDILRNDGVIIYPTDTVYAFGCNIMSSKAIERIAKIKNIDYKKANFSFLIEDLSQINDFAKPFSNGIFKLIRRNVPGPFTFILEANNSLPKLLKNNKKTIGIRIPDSVIARDILLELGSPLITSSIPLFDEDEEMYPTDPENIYEKWKNVVDIVIDGGIGGAEHSTIVDCVGEEPEIVRQGRGVLI